MICLRTTISVRDAEPMKRHAHRQGVDCIFERNRVLRPIIRWTVSVDRIDWSTANFAGELMHEKI